MQRGLVLALVLAACSGATEGTPGDPDAGATGDAQQAVSQMLTCDLTYGYKHTSPAGDVEGETHWWTSMTLPDFSPDDPPDIRVTRCEYECFGVHCPQPVR